MRTRRELAFLCSAFLLSPPAAAQDYDFGWCAQQLPNALQFQPGSVLPSMVEFIDVNDDGRLDVFFNGGVNGVRLAFGSPHGGFQTAETLAYPESANDIESSDLDGDGNIDLVVRPMAEGNAQIFLGNGKGNFSLSTSYSMSSSSSPEASDLSLGDVNGDGRVDLLAVDTGTRELCVRLGLGGGLFGAPTFTALGGYPGKFELGDVDGDGDLDFVGYGALQTSKLGVLLGDGTGNFNTSVASTINAFPFVLRDIDGDGKLDIASATAGQGNGALRVFLGAGNGSFTLASIQPLGEELRNLALGDFDGDGKLDAVVVGRYGAAWVLDGLGAGFFAPPKRLLVPDARFVARAADVDGDGYDDVALLGSVSVGVLYGSPLQSLVEPTTVALGGTAKALVAADFDADNHNDVAVARVNGAGWALEILRGDSTGALTLGASSNFSAEPVELASADFDGDGTLDVISVSPSGALVELVRGIPGGNLAPAVTLKSGSAFVALATADIHHDGRDDVFAISAGESVLHMVRGTMTLPPIATTIQLPAIAVDVATGDVNGDGFPDVIVATAAQSLLWLRGSFAGLAAPVEVIVGRPITSIDVARLDSDGFADVVYGTEEDGLVVRRGSSGGLSFFDAVIGPSVHASRVRALDLDSDGRVDLAYQTSLGGDDYLCVRRGDGTGFRESACHSFTNAPGARGFIDLDRDGWAEVLSAEPAQALLRVSQRRKGPRFASYCPAGTSIAGCVGQLSASGVPSASAGNGLILSTQGIDAQRSGLVFFGTAYPLVQPWAAGSSSFMCLGSPRLRTLAQFTFGTAGQCNGAVSVDGNTAAANAGLDAGSIVFAQTWYRDPLAPKGGQLSNALAFELGF